MAMRKYCNSYRCDYELQYSFVSTVLIIDHFRVIYRIKNFIYRSDIHITVYFTTYW